MLMKFVGKETGVERYNSPEEVPYEFTGYTSDLSKEREAGACVHRAELDNQPMYKGWAGPMWDGDCLRYETWKLYEAMSM